MPSQRRNPSRAAPTYQPYNGPPPPRSIKSLSQESEFIAEYQAVTADTKMRMFHASSHAQFGRQVQHAVQLLKELYPGSPIGLKRVAAYLGSVACKIVKKHDQTGVPYVDGGLTQAYLLHHLQAAQDDQYPTGALYVVNTTTGKLRGFVMYEVKEAELAGKVLYVPAICAWGAGFHLLKRLEQVAEEVGCSFILLHSVRAAYKFYHDMGYSRRTAAALYRSLDKCVLKMADLEKGENISWTKPEASMTGVPWMFRNHVEGSDEDFLFREEVEAAMRNKLSTVKKNWSSKDEGELKQKLLKHNKELIKDAIDSLWGTLLINGFYMAKLVKPKWVDSLKKWAQQEHQWAHAEDTKTWKEVY